MRFRILILLIMINNTWSGTVIFAEAKKIVAKSEEANVALYAAEADGMYRDFEPKLDNGTRFFPFWMNVTNPAYAPEILYHDLNRDGKKDLIIVLKKGYGTGVLDSEVHVLQRIRTNIGENYQEVLVDNPLAIIFKNVKTKLAPPEAIVTVAGKDTVINFERFKIPPNHLFEDVYFGSIVKFDVVDNQLVASVDGQIGPSMSIGSIEITYEYKDKMYQAKKIKFKKDI